LVDACVLTSKRSKLAASVQPADVRYGTRFAW
jgi:hypothetical protein